MKEQDIRPRELFSRYLGLARRDVAHFFSDESAREPVPCPACGGHESNPTFTKHTFAYRVCGACRSLFVSPRPAEEAFNTFYTDGESVRYWSSDFYRKTAEARREKIHRPRAQIVANFPDTYPDVPMGPFVDIGCGYGVFLEEVAATGRFTDILGIEPGPSFVEHCRALGFDILPTRLEDVPPDETGASVATAFEILEHVYDPLRFLQAARGVLAPGGLLYLTTLTATGFDIQVLWERSQSVFPPHHINLLSIQGLSHLIERAGFTIESMRTPGRLDVDIVANAVMDEPTTSLPRFVETLLHQDEETQARFQEFLAENLLSSHIQIVARRGK